MAKGIKVRAKVKDDTVTVKALMKHPMETGSRKNKKTGKLIPAHYIQEVTCTHNGNNVLSANWAGGISKNPYLSFKFKGGAKGDTITVAWVDNKGENESLDAKIK